VARAAGGADVCGFARTYVGVPVCIRKALTPPSIMASDP
jgi:hypothetical protein